MAVERGMVRRGEQLWVVLAGMQEALEGLSPSNGRAQFRLTRGRHAREPIKAICAEGGQSGNGDDAQDPLWQGRATSQCVRASTRMSNGREALEPQCIGDAGNVRGR